ncbi:MAG: alpha-glucan family phosphorylase [Candidatus Omnitrophica bacterium]|nr:alpha-glucan family phosphorylase [Candidatus Omnitrophota bacterium]
MPAERRIAYFSMEIAIEPSIPTYSGGLGVLAGDTIRTAADLHVPMVAITLLHRKGYFTQRIDAQGWQQEEPVTWSVKSCLEGLPESFSVVIEGRTVFLRAWKYDVTGCDGFVVPVLFLDSDVPENNDWDRALTHYLYGGDARYRLCQEAILGMGGVKALRALGFREINRFHMNEGHASLLTLALLEEQAQREGREYFTSNDIEQVRQQCVFTTHTPVPAGHDQFGMDLAIQVLGRRDMIATQELFGANGQLNLTMLALNLSRYVNGVAKRHSEVSKAMFALEEVDAITNGVHAGTWVSEPFQALFDAHIPSWREDNFSLRHALKIPSRDIWEAHLSAKRKLLDYVNQHAMAGMSLDVFTIGFARRAALYKRADLLFHDVERLKRIVSSAGPFQLIYAGKAHPHDQAGKELIQRIIKAKEALKPSIKIAYLENYDMHLGKLITAGADVWLNTPQPPLEASGTSGMKAALNGVPSLSTLDGWWVEGHLEGVTGWAIGADYGHAATQEQSANDAASLYDKLEQVILPLFYRNHDGYINVMQHAIALNGSFFNTQRMVQEYVLKGYFH